MVKFIDGGVTAPQGFKANGIWNGIKESRKTFDTALLYSDVMCEAAGMFTTNKVKAECVKLDMERIKSGKAQAVIVNVCYANACTGAKGMEIAIREGKSAADALNLKEENVLVCSTGIIGQQLPVEKVEAGMEKLAAGLSKEGHTNASLAIMTTDTKNKECAVETVIGGKTVRIGAMCKGSGMIHINMGTMLSFNTTDCAITNKMLLEALHKVVPATYNCVSVDGDTSTNDTILLLANGKAGNSLIDGPGEDFDIFVEALKTLCVQMAKKIAADGEGASHMVECTVHGACCEEKARVIAKSVISSSLVKAAFFGKDANCGRILCAMGYSGADFDPDKVKVDFASVDSNGDYQSVTVIQDGVGLEFDEDHALKVLEEKEIFVHVYLGEGDAEASAWGCDLTYDYVKINGDYRS